MMDETGFDIGKRGTYKFRQTARFTRLSPISKDKVSPTADELCQLMLAVASERDRAAFATLFTYFAPRVKGFLMRSGLSALAADEVAQETMLTIWRKASYFDPHRASLATWIFTIARNHRIDRLRRERNQINDAVSDPSDEPVPPFSGEDIVIAIQREERVRSALASLSVEQAAIVRMSYFAEKPHAQIANELGIPLGTVKSRIRLALSRLRGLLGGEA